jgi:hypothetical protein
MIIRRSMRARSSDRRSTRAKSAYAGMYLFVNSSSK